MKTKPKPSRYYLLSTAALLLLLTNLYGVRAFIIFGSPILFSLALLIEFILLGTFIYSFLRLLVAPESIIKSVALSLWGGLLSNEYVKRIGLTKSRLLQWIRRRFSAKSPSGLPFTLTIITSTFFLFNFLSLLFAVTTRGSLTQIDKRVLNLIPDIRTPTQTNFFRAVTFLANAQTLIFIIVIVTTLLWITRQRVLAAIFVIVILVEEGVTDIVKHLVHRMRPARALSLMSESSLSFPSSHAIRATLIFGILAYIAYKSHTSARARLTTLISYVLAVFLVGVSRIYLGVHYPTDVWGGILLAGAMLALVIGFLEISNRYELRGRKRLRIQNRSLSWVPLVLVVFALIASPTVVHIRPVAAIRVHTTLPLINRISIQKIPLYSETLTGSRMEPISFIYVGDKNQIISIFLSHGWYKADPSTLGNTLRAFAVGFQGRQYQTAPVTPSYLNSKPENMAFEKSTKSHSLRQRHHTRIWQTDFVSSDRKPIWVATASFDEGIEFAGPAKLPTHHIDPNIDAERAYITKSLGLPINLIHVVDPELGKNASGDSFFTDGNAELVYLK